MRTGETELGEPDEKGMRGLAWMPKRVLVTGAGTLGTELARQLQYRCLEVRMMDHSEEALWRLEEALPNKGSVTYFLGDIKDINSVRKLMYGCDMCIHTAALKHVKFTNISPIEAHETNVGGVINMVEAAMESRTMERFVFISSDKACYPTNIYGETKRIGETITTWANRQAHRGLMAKSFSSMRFGNFLGSHGSVFDRWKRQREDGVIHLTNPHMNRFFIKPKEVAEFVIRQACNRDTGGTVVVPIMMNLNMGLVAEIVAKKWKVEVERDEPVPGEKLDEVIIGEEEAPRTELGKDGFIIRPNVIGGGLTGQVSTRTMPISDRIQTEDYIEEVI
jgi:UDP-N-acetylglucosamine 4,6-dehydratase/5-epimerase